MEGMVQKSCLFINHFLWVIDNYHLGLFAHFHADIAGILINFHWLHVDTGRRYDEWVVLTCRMVVIINFSCGDWAMWLVPVRVVTIY